MAASLHHAQPILTAAINAGFRESGIQSLKNLDDANSFPMIAIRSSGLALESVVGVVIEEKVNDACRADADDIRELVDSIVTEEYLELLVNLANERFRTNAERRKRFEDDLFGQEKRLEVTKEDREVRRARKRAEGLEKQYGLRNKASMPDGSQAGHSNEEQDGDQENDVLLGL